MPSAPLLIGLIELADGLGILLVIDADAERARTGQPVDVGGLRPNSRRPVRATLP